MSRRDGEGFFLQKPFGTVFQFRVTMVENFNEKVLQMLVSSLNVALALFSHEMNEFHIVL